jgi:hypothetical protein
MRELVVVLCVLAAGCNARLGAASQVGDDQYVDANGSGSGSGSGQHDAAVPLCATGRQVYLEFEGATITQAQNASDATQSKAVWMGVASATMTKFRPNAADRATQIQDVVDRIKGKLAAFPEIQVVTTRPAAGPYVMIGFGDVHQTVNVPYLYAVNRLDCGDQKTKNDLAWVFEDVPNTRVAADTAVGSILFGLGATGTTNPDDCMCGWLTQCQSSNNACTLGTSVNAALSCNGQTNPQNEVAIMQTFCQ